MNEKATLQLPADWHDIPAGFPLVDEGDYTVKTVRMQHDNHSRVEAGFEILDDGVFHGRRIFQTYTLTADAGKRLFKELIEVLGVATDAGTLDTSACLDKVLVVTVKHNAKDGGRTYANVNAHRDMETYFTEH